jgi:hypothetical protein
MNVNKDRDELVMKMLSLEDSKHYCEADISEMLGGRAYLSRKLFKQVKGTVEIYELDTPFPMTRKRKVVTGAAFKFTLRKYLQKYSHVEAKSDGL